MKQVVLNCKHKCILLVIIYIVIFSAQVQGQRQRGHRNRPAFSFQAYEHSTGSLGTDISSDDDVAGSSGVRAPEFQQQPRRHSNVNEVDGNSNVLPLFKQSYPGLYVKGHAAENFKYEPTRQVAHHHGPNYRDSSNSNNDEEGFEQNPFSFNF